MPVVVNLFTRITQLAATGNSREVISTFGLLAKGNLKRGESFEENKFSLVYGCTHFFNYFYVIHGQG